MRNRIPALSLLTILCLFLVFSESYGQWVSIGPPGGCIKHVAQDPVSPQNLYGILSGYPSRFIKSTDRGETWSIISELNYYMYTIAIEPSTPSRILMGGSARIAESTNGGQSWTTRYQSGYSFDEMIYDDQDNIVHGIGNRYISSQNVVQYYRSTNGGDNWSSQQVAEHSFYAYCFTVDPDEPDHIYIGGYKNTTGTNETCAYRSTNGGQNWTEISSGLSGFVRGIAFDTVNDRLYAGTFNGVYRSTNGGTVWTRNSGLAYAYTLALDPNNDNRVYAGYSNKIYRSTDKGVTFSSYSGGLYGEQSLQLFVDHALSSNVYLTNYAGFFKSEDGGKNWNGYTSGYCSSDIEAVRVHPLDPSTLYVAFDNNAVYKTTNALGKTAAPADVSWVRLQAFYDCHNIADFEFGPFDPDVVYALEGGG